MKEQQHSVGKNYIYNLISSVFNILLPIITTPYISSALGVENIGIYSFTYSYITMFTLTGALGSATHGQRTIARSQDNIIEKSKAFYEIFILRLITISISLVLYFITISIYGQHYIYFVLQIPYFIGAIFDITWFFQGNDNFSFLTMRNITFKLLGFVFILLFVKDTGNLAEYVTILALSNLLSSISMWPLLRKRIVKIHFKQLSIKEHFGASFVYFIPTLAYQLYSTIDKVLLGFMGNSVETGYYEQANKIVTLATTVLSSYNVVIRTKMNYVYRQYELAKTVELKKDVDDTLDRAISFVLFLACPISAGIFSISDNLTGWFFGPGFEKVSDLLKLFCVMVLVNSFRGLLGASVFNPLGIKMQKKSNKAQWIAAILNLGLTALLIPKFYSYGAIAASMISETVILILYFYYAREILNFKRIFNKLLKYMICAVVMAATIYWLDNFMTGILCTVVQIIAGAVVYFCLLLLIKDSFFCTTMYNVLSRITRKVRK